MGLLNAISAKTGVLGGFSGGGAGGVGGTVINNYYGASGNGAAVSAAGGAAIGSSIYASNTNTISSADNDKFVRLEKNHQRDIIQRQNSAASGNLNAAYFRNKDVDPKVVQAENNASRAGVVKLKAQRDKELQLQIEINKIMEEHKKTLKALADLHANNKREIEAGRGGRLSIASLNEAALKLKSNLDKKTEAALSGIGVKNGSTLINNPYSYNLQERQDAIHFDYFNKLIADQKKKDMLRNNVNLRNPYTGEAPPLIPGAKRQSWMDVFHSNEKKSGMLHSFKQGYGGLGLSAGGPGGLMGGAAALLGFLGPLKLVTVALVGLYKSIKYFEEGIQHGAETYQHAAKLALDVNKTAQIENAFKAIGMETPDLSILQGQFGKKGGSVKVPDTDIILRAARTGQIGNAQQLTNMAEQFKAAMADGAASARQMASASKAAQESSMEGAAVMREWRTMLTQLAVVFKPLIDGILISISNWLKIANLVLEGIIKFMQLIHLVPNGATNFSKVPGMGGMRGGHESAWEKMGFVFGSAHSNDPNSPNNPNNPSKQIANNTSKTVTTLNKILTVLTESKREKAGFPISSLP